MNDIIKICKDYVVQNPTIGTLAGFVVVFPLYIYYKVKVDGSLANNKYNFPTTTKHEKGFKQFQSLKNEQVKNKGSLLGR